MPTAQVSTAFGPAAKRVGGELLGLVEDQWFDRKSIRISPQKLADAEVSFANAEGGTLVIGLLSGTVEGTDASDKHRNALIQAAIDFTHPPVRTRNRLVQCVNSAGRSDHLLVIDVEPSDIVHANNKDEVFLRIGDETRKLTFLQRQELLYDKGQAAYEATAVAGTTHADLRAREEIKWDGLRRVVGVQRVVPVAVEVVAFQR